eukprot:5727989-Pyramimonas_sp.AAC.1
MHKQVEQLQQALREAKGQPLAAAEGELEVVEAEELACTRARTAELDSPIEHLGRIKPMPEQVMAITEEYKQGRLKLRAELFDANLLPSSSMH